MIGPTRPGIVDSVDRPVIAGPSAPPQLVSRSLPNVSQEDDKGDIDGDGSHRDHDYSGGDNEGDDDDGNNYEPDLPPSMAHRKLQGPSMLANIPQRIHPINNSESTDEDEDEEVGPLPPNSYGIGSSLTAAEEFRVREKRLRDQEEERKRLENGKSKREEWMLIPPSSLDLVGNVDPTKIKSRGFVQSAKKGGTIDKASDEGRALWTETPDERARRINDEVMGKRNRLENAGKQESEAERIERKKRESRDAEQQARVEAYNTAVNRTETLVDKHTQRTAQEAIEEKDRARKRVKKGHRKSSRSPSPPPAAFWDRDKMMGAGRLMDEGKRKELVGSSSVNLNSKFGGGKYL